MLTPLDIENKKFSKQVMNGYNVEDVDDFLDELVVDYGKNYKELAEANLRIEKKTTEITLKKSRNNTTKYISYGTINSRRSKKCCKTTSRSIDE